MDNEKLIEELKGILSLIDVDRISQDDLASAGDRLESVINKLEGHDEEE